MSLVTNITDLAQAMGNEVKALRTLVNGNASDLSGLTTTAKSNIVAAINEVDAAIDALTANSGAVINDSAASTTQVYSSSKTTSVVNNAVAQVKSDILGGAGAAYDTLSELKALIDSGDATDQASIATLTTALGNRVRFDAAQTLTTAQQTQALANIGGQAASTIGDPTTNFVTTFNTAKA